jgi:hypothetical protein
MAEGSPGQGTAQDLEHAVSEIIRGAIAPER